ncbi:MAG: aspartyl/asparaginyl beta-hydroxylase domain-containing protein [Gammaproteobacteria bacterium]|nr:aspartyl/asparaginyl beta-hydroxylase domain-containing protein [Gammaproteobacteria bacterium]
MNSGTHLLEQRVSYFEELIHLNEKIAQGEWTPTHPDGPYASGGWRVVKFIDNGAKTKTYERYHAQIESVLSNFHCPINMAVLYSVLPGAILHEHRDVSATLEFGRLRFHVPVITHEDVDFFVSRKKVPMRAGNLWALNTSYLHAINNRSNVDRIHFVLEVDANEWVWSKLPKKNIKWFLHYAFFMTLLLKQGIVAIVSDRKKLPAYKEMSVFILRRLMNSVSGKFKRP